MNNILENFVSFKEYNIKSMKKLTSLAMYTVILLLIIYILILENYIWVLEESLDNDNNILIFNTLDLVINSDINNINKNNNKFLFPKYLNLFNIISDNSSINNNMVYCKSYFTTNNLNYYQNKYISYNDLTSIDKLNINMPMLNNIKITPELELLENAFYTLEQNAIVYARVLEDIRIILNI